MLREERLRLPVLLGMNNPQGGRPLTPHPPGCAGWRLWQLSGMERDVWMRSFQRKNVLRNREWDRGAARAEAPDVWAGLAGRRVVVLGHGVREAVGLPRVPWILLQMDDRYGTQWRFLPHPSGRCQLYNDVVVREAVRLVLQEMANGHP